MKLTRNWTPDPSVLSAKRSHGSQLSIWRRQITWSLGVKYHFYWAVRKTHSATLDIWAHVHCEEVSRKMWLIRLWCQNSSKSLWTTLKTKLIFCRFNICAIFFKHLYILSLVEQKKITVPVCDKTVLYLRSLIPAGDISHWTPFSHAPLATSAPHRLLALFILLFFFHIASF